MFDITGKTLKPVSEARSSDEMERWWNILAEEGRAKKAIESLQKSMTSTEIEALARQVFEEVSVTCGGCRCYTAQGIHPAFDR